MKQKLTYFRRTRTFVLSLLLLSCMAAQGQQQPSRMVKGLVKDARTGEPLAGVAVLVRGTTQGTTTGISGEYAVSVPSGSTELEFSFLGYVAKIQKIGTAHTLDVTMEEEATGLQEVVVVGYGVQKKANPCGFGISFYALSLRWKTRQPGRFAAYLPNKRKRFVWKNTISSSPCC